MIRRSETKYFFDVFHCLAFNETPIIILKIMVALENLNSKHTLVNTVVSILTPSNICPHQKFWTRNAYFFSRWSWAKMRDAAVPYNCIGRLEIKLPKREMLRGYHATAGGVARSLLDKFSILSMHIRILFKSLTVVIKMECGKYLFIF